MLSTIGGRHTQIFQTRNVGSRETLAVIIVVLGSATVLGTVIVSSQARDSAREGSYPTSKFLVNGVTRILCAYVEQTNDLGLSSQVLLLKRTKAGNRFQGSFLGVTMKVTINVDSTIRRNTCQSSDS